MIIRCERCSTLYELDEALLAPEGSPVQCTRCQAVFSARPPRPAPEAAMPAAPAPGAAPPAPTLTPVATPAQVVAAAAPPSPPAASSPAPAPAPRPVRPGPAVYRPPAPAATAAPAAQPGGARAAPGRRGTVGAFDARAQRATIGRRLLVPAAALVAVALVLLGTVLWRRRPDPEVQRLAAEAVARLTQDDAGSLSRAVQLYDGVLAKAPARRDLAAERALARLLQAAAQLEEAEPYAEQLASRNAERGRLLSEQQGGSDDAVRLLAVEATRLEGELAPRRKAAEALVAQATAELKQVAGAPGGERLAARGLGVLAVLAGDPDEASRQAALARAGGADPWADLAEAWGQLRAAEGRERALAGLSALASAHPELVRARWLLARAQAAAGRREEATATLAGLLAANPRHERAQRLKAQLAAPPPPAAAAPAAAPQAQPWRQPVPVRPAPAPVPAPAAPGPSPAAPPPAPSTIPTAGTTTHAPPVEAAPPAAEPPPAPPPPQPQPPTEPPRPPPPPVRRPTWEEPDIPAGG